MKLRARFPSCCRFDSTADRVASLKIRSALSGQRDRGIASAPQDVPAAGRRARNEEQGFGNDYLGFLASCGIELEIGGYSEHDGERVAELVQRTNQLNFSGRKYSREELQKIIANPTLGKYVLRVSDKYGSYGTVGFCLVKDKPDTVEVLDFMLSCRVQSKFIEQALFSHLLEHHNPGGAKAIWVNFKKTDRNTPAHNVLCAIGFQPCETRRWLEPAKE